MQFFRKNTHIAASARWRPERPRCLRSPKCVVKGIGCGQAQAAPARHAAAVHGILWHFLILVLYLLRGDLTAINLSGNDFPAVLILPFTYFINHYSCRRQHMKAPIFALSVFVFLGSFSGMVAAKGCLKGAAVGGAAGHVAGKHGLVGAAAGCAIGRHAANKKAKDQAAQAAPATTPPASPQTSSVKK